METIKQVPVNVEKLVHRNKVVEVPVHREVPQVVYVDKVVHVDKIVEVPKEVNIEVGSGRACLRQFTRSCGRGSARGSARLPHPSLAQ